MRVALINPRWRFDGSIYFGCREPHLPLEFGYARQRLEAAGHEAAIIDAHLFDLDREALRDALSAFGADMAVVTTAPSYLFWRCPPSELRAPRETLDAVRDLVSLTVAVGPHGSTTPASTLRKLNVDAVVMGECEEVLPRLCREHWDRIPAIAYADDGRVKVQGAPHAGNFADLGPLFWPEEWIKRRQHHHHRFDAAPAAPGAEVEASRGCPYRCSFCAKENFRDKYRRRAVEAIEAELTALKRQGVEYVYFIDEIFLPNRPLLEMVGGLGLKFGVQTRIDLWKPEMLRLLGEAGCVSIEAGVESLSEAGRDALDKNCRMSTDDLTERLILARRHVPFVQANLLQSENDDPAQLAAWRERVRSEGVWANDPVPLFPYPGSPDYRKLWGLPDDSAWERAHAYYLEQYDRFSDVQQGRPLPLSALERGMAA